MCNVHFRDKQLFVFSIFVHNEIAPPVVNIKAFSCPCDETKHIKSNFPASVASVKFLLSLLHAYSFSPHSHNAFLWENASFLF